LLKNANFADALSDTPQPRAETQIVTVHAGSLMPHPVHEIFASVLRIPADSISDETSPENTPRWDSLQSINLVLALEEEFGVALGTRDIVEMKNVGFVKAVLRRKGAAGV
jgi:acyl carrier protein